MKKQSPAEKGFLRWWSKNWNKLHELHKASILHDPTKCAWLAALKWFKRTHCKKDGRCDRA